MEKQIFIKHTRDDVDSMIYDIIRYFDAIMTPTLKVVCKFHLNKEQYNLLDKIKEYHDSKIVRVEPKNGMIFCVEYYDIELCFSYDRLKALLQVVVKNELNVTIFCDSIKMVLNDNDGDFIIVDSRNPNYNFIKGLSLQI